MNSNIEKKKIAIVGAGQAGLQLAMSLLEDRAHEVTLFSDRTSEEIAGGPLMATAIMFHNKRTIERALGLDFWEDQGTPVSGIEISICSEGGELATAFSAPFTDGAGMALDFRLKFPAWMDEFERRGGRLVIRKTGIGELEQLAAENDLVVVAAGKGPLSKLFERDPDRSPPYNAPMRHIVAVVVDRDLGISNMAISIIPGGAEIVLLPILDAEGKRSTAILVFSQTGTSFHEEFRNIESGDEALEMALRCATIYCPEYADRLCGARLTDARSHLHGAFTPVVRKPVGHLPSGAIVMGASDCLTLVDPICGNGLNNAAVMSKILAERIASNERGRFDEAWMQSTFDEFWNYGKDVYIFMRALLEQPPYFGAALEPASRCPALASDIVNGYTDPVAFARWMEDAPTAQVHIDRRVAVAMLGNPNAEQPAKALGRAAATALPLLNVLLWISVLGALIWTSGAISSGGEGNSMEPAAIQSPLEGNLSGPGHQSHLREDASRRP
ncbi:MAG: styrene monooxygenase/indole monooxygenase family protein [Verrucomicrobiales bacterium]